MGFSWAMLVSGRVHQIITSWWFETSFISPLPPMIQCDKPGIFRMGGEKPPTAVTTFTITIYTHVFVGFLSGGGVQGGGG